MNTAEPLVVPDQQLESGNPPTSDFKVDATTEEFKKSVRDHLVLTLARDPEFAGDRDWWTATSLAVRDKIMERSAVVRRAHAESNVRRVYYLSLEYLMGRLLENNLVNCGLFETAREALAEMGHDIDAISECGPDLGLGNGGLGRLAACFIDSLATLDLPAVGYGIHYEFGLFKQEFVGGKQIEHPDVWRRFGNPWEIIRPEYEVTVNLYGHVEQDFDDLGQGQTVWKGCDAIIGVPWDIPIVGYGCHTVNFLRLWEARASRDLDLDIFNEGGYLEAVRGKTESETVSKVLYPNDSTAAGKELRLVQQYFFVACSLRDIIRRHFRSNNTWDSFPEKAAIQLNDTHPALAVVELMRIMVDEELLPWDQAWKICRATFAYTNHTLLPEALERWSVPLFEKVLPRHLQLVYEINKRFLENEVAKEWPGDNQKMSELSIIEEGYPKNVRMAHLAVVGSHAVNGVAALHTELLKRHLFHDFNQMYPGKFQNKTNGITPRRWLKACNPGLSSMIDEAIGTDWPRHLDRLKDLESKIEDPAWVEQFAKVKRDNKVRLASLIQERCEGLVVDPDAMFDVQIKRLHEYKRQHLNLLHILTLYRRLLRNPDLDVSPRVFVFGAKAAPGYELAKEIIHAINAVGEKINGDIRIKGKLKVAFIPNYNVSVAEVIIPAADLSEQISTAGKEASGTGNMKLSLNGALTIGTLDGANVEIGEEVGDENIFIFGLTVDEVEKLWEDGYSSMDYYWGDEELRDVIDWLSSDYFSGEKDAFSMIRHSLLEGNDPYLVLADYRAYIDCQDKVGEAYKDQTKWMKTAILNTARMGKFSSDRTIQQYAEEIWDLLPFYAQ